MSRNPSKPFSTQERPQQTQAGAPRSTNELVTTRSRPTHEQIARRAFELFEARGRADGFADRDWMQAERELSLGRQ